ncbi:MAG TPA: hypothetical protein VF297_32405 [Pyrinomonadaceae bacterium]
MAGRKTTAKSSGGAGNGSNGRHAKAAPAGKLIKKDEAKHAQPSAYELGLRAWQTTYKNSRKSKAA